MYGLEMLTMGSIIAITGLAGHAIGSWSLPDGQMWLRDFLPHDAPDARILTYGYDARVQGHDLATSTLGELAEEFLDGLITMRDCTPNVSSLSNLRIDRSVRNVAHISAGRPTVCSWTYTIAACILMKRKATCLDRT